MRPPPYLLALSSLLLSLPSRASAADAPPAGAPGYTLGGYVEAFYQYNLARPSNGITNYRGFDNRHNTFTLSNAAVDAAWDAEGLVGHLALQVGHTPSTYYLAEPALGGAAGANESNAALWKYLQQAHGGYRFAVGGGLSLTAGLFLSPIGPEGMAVKDNFNWSRSNLFFGLPFYHTGARVTYQFTEAWAATLAVYNGWNSVVDGNPEKSPSAQVTYTKSLLIVSALYFGGVERPESAPEGRAWRHLFDGHATLQPTGWLSFIAHGNAGFERNRFGTSRWAAGALYGRVMPAKGVYFALRADLFREDAGSSAKGQAAPIFWPVRWVSSGTATVDLRPHERVSFRFEGRHDRASGEMFFGGDVPGDGAARPYAPNRRSQSTVTLGVTSWFLAREKSSPCLDTGARHSRQRSVGWRSSSWSPSRRSVSAGSSGGPNASSRRCLSPSAVPSTSAPEPRSRPPAPARSGQSSSVIAASRPS